MPRYGEYAAVRVEGGRRLRATMKAAGHDLDDLKAAHAAAVGIVVPVAQAGAPVEDGYLAGSVRGAGTVSAAIIRAGKKLVPYAAPIHWGWFKKHIRPNPWLSRAAQTTEPAWQRVYIDAVDQAIDQIKGL